MPILMKKRGSVKTEQSEIYNSSHKEKKKPHAKQVSVAFKWKV